jgi:hypothetical protein
MSSVRSANERVGVVAELAYRLWEERGCPEGSPEEDWYKAELIIDHEPDRQGENGKSLETQPGQV